MHPGSLPPEVLAFLDGHVSSVPQLQSLLLAREAGEEGVTPAALAAELRLSERVVAAWLEHFVRRQVLRREGDAYVCAPSAAVDAVADTYARRPVTVSRHIYAANGPARRFADAFLFRDDPREP